MKKIVMKMAGIMLALSMVVGFSLPAFAAGGSAPDSEIVISSLQNKDPLVKGKKINLEVHVQRDKISDPAKTVKDESKAMVYVFFTKGKDSRQAQLTVTKHGKYEGSIKLPTSGKWQVNVMAMVPDPTLGQNGTDKMQTTWDVHEYHIPAWVWILGVLLVILIAVIVYFSVKASRRKKVRKEEEKKARLLQQKNKKKKKKR